MIKKAQAKALDDLLEHAGENVQFSPKVGPEFPLRVLYGKNFSLQSAGNFQISDYEHQFLCRAADVEGKTRDGEITLDGKTFTVVHVDTQKPAVMLHCE